MALFIAGMCTKCGEMKAFPSVALPKDYGLDIDGFEIDDMKYGGLSVMKCSGCGFITEMEDAIEDQKYRNEQQRKFDEEIIAKALIFTKQEDGHYEVRNKDNYYLGVVKDGVFFSWESRSDEIGKTSEELQEIVDFIDYGGYEEE